FRGKAGTVLLAGGFGGATLDAMVTLGIDDERWILRQADEAEHSDGMLKGLEALREIARSGTDLRNGLVAKENLHLARTHRASEVAALVGLGIVRNLIWIEVSHGREKRQRCHDGLCRRGPGDGRRL
ncbi:MAG TPA: hypothetical protein VFA32_23185, partial [Dehalococcoidia bacterium]|nr:hypothetical protein [Dehalococcoidia bacterium]